MFFCGVFSLPLVSDVSQPGHNRLVCPAADLEDSDGRTIADIRFSPCFFYKNPSRSGRLLIEAKGEWMLQLGEKAE